MKAILISIKPQWCEKIASRWKYIELRKSKPNIQMPFKCYIYQTKHKWVFRLLQRLGMERVSETLINGSGKVIGEFVCDNILGHCEMANADLAEKGSFVRREDIAKYSGGKEVFGWHISDLKIYEKPKDVTDFRKPFPFNKACSICDRGGTSFHPETCYGCEHFDGIEISSPPQSWCYVEAISSEDESI